MRKIILSLALFLSVSMPLSGWAADIFSQDLRFGVSNNDDVKKLQEFLTIQGLYGGPANGNFFSLTKEAVIKFQKRENINPASGYFGPLTRRAANNLSAGVIASVKTKEEIIAELIAQIQKLQVELQTQQDKLKQEQLSVKSETQPVVVPVVPVAGTSSEPIVPVPVPTKTVKISGVASSKAFSDTSASPFKLTDIVVTNDTDENLLFANFEILISDEMESPANRNHKVYFILRDGPAAEDGLISSTEHTFVLTNPKLGEPHKVFVNLPFDVLLAQGKKKNVSLWVEQLLYVNNGKLSITSTKLNATKDIQTEGAFSVVLTKTPY